MIIIAIEIVAVVLSINVASVDLSGNWEIQSLQGDKLIKIDQTKRQFKAYRSLHKEHNGKRFKLKHFYRGTVSKDGRLIGKLFVKQYKKYEYLRKFVGKLVDNGLVELDGFLLKRHSINKVAAVKKNIVSPKKFAGQIPIFGGAVGSNRVTASSLANSKLVQNGVFLPVFFNGQQLSVQAIEFVELGEELFSKKKYRKARSMFYEADKLLSGKVLYISLQQRIAASHLRIGAYNKARRLLKKLCEDLPDNEILTRDYKWSITRKP